jgi:acetoin utilization deacetylase AcuC-like enzyme
MAIVLHDTYMARTQPDGHPESPARTEAIVRKLGELGLLGEPVRPDAAAEGELALAHDPGYLRELARCGEGYLDPDTYLMPDGYQLALNAAGGALAAARGSYGEKKPWFALTRPPGHHAGRAHSGGFCYLNNAALAAAVLLPEVHRVAIVDYDVHHGNGTSEIFYGSHDVLYVSTHQWGIYPGTGHYAETGEGRGEGYTVNIPLPPGSGDATFRAAFDEVIHPVVEGFKPGAIIVSLGVDAHYRDYLASLTLSSKGYVGLCARTIELARKACQSRLAFVLEGGYNLEALAEVVAGTVMAFEGKETELQFNDVSDTECVGRQAVDAARMVHAEKWGL